MTEPSGTGEREASGSRSLDPGDAPTVTLGASRSGTATTGTRLSPMDALHREEIRRLRVFVVLAGVFVSGVALVMPFARPERAALWVMESGFVVTVPFIVLMMRLLRRAEVLPMGPLVAFGYACIYGVACGTYCFGLFSPASGVAAFGIFFFSPSSSFAAALAIYAGAAAFHAGLSTAILTGLVADRGLVHAGDVPLGVKLLMLGLVQGVYLASFLVGRATRRATLRAIDAHDAAIAELAQREDLLKEAHHELAEALRVGGLGRYSDQALGSFRLGTVIGRGAMGEVYEATHLTTGAPAAVKLLHHETLSHAEYVRRFVRETKIVTMIESEHVCRVLEVGGVDAELPYIAMERLVGEDLAERLRKKRRLPAREVARLLREAGAGLDAAGQAGVVHRDVNPKNLFLAQAEGTKKRVWKVLDFGVSKVADGASALTEEAVVGTPAFMAPEQAEGRAVTLRSDLFSLAVVAYRALLGEPPFAGATAPELLYAVVHTAPVQPSALARLPRDVDLVFAVALAKDPGDRFDSGAELALAFERALSGELDADTRSRGATLEERLPWRARS